jgi:hypothetical protein
MSFQYSTTVRNAKLDQIETTIGTAAVLKVFSGAEPANCAAADPSGLLATLNLPSDWMAAAASGAKALLGSWTATASGTGTAASWRIYDSGLVACHIQGNTTDMTFNNTNIASGQTVTVTAFTITAGNA